MIRVAMTNQAGEVTEFAFDKDSVMVGRAAGNDIVLEVPGFSRYHARLSIDGQNLSIEDVGSTNGTFVNGERITQRQLGDGELVTIGNHVFRCWYEPAAAEDAGMPDAPEQPLDPEPSPTASAVSRRIAQLVSEKQPASGEERTVAESRSAAASPSVPKSDDASASASTGSGSIAKSEEFYWQSLKSFLAPVWDAINDDAVSEILINGPTEIYIEKKGQLQELPVVYHNEQLKAAVLNIAQYVGRRVSEEEPYLDARLPDGSRVAILMPPCSRKGISISIRKFAKEKLTLERLLGFGSLSEDMVEYLRAAVLLKKNIIVSGGTSSGKTSLLNVVSGLIPDDERILTIEDSAELQLRQRHVLPMETRPPDKKGRGQVTIRDLVRASLRMRPDRIVVGEIRGGEALDLLQAMNTGHSGSMATVHASSPPQALTRMETLALFSGLEIPMRALREQVSSALEVIIQASRLPDHSRKVTYISEVQKLSESGDYQVKDIFKFSRTSGMSDGRINGKHLWTGATSAMLEEMELAGLQRMVDFFRSGASA